ncbi:MAG: hypothetical protein IKX59_02010 [Bacteroidales bacterium]|nr:hypothetical protein [Bacteroidales bacterium]
MSTNPFTENSKATDPTEVITTQDAEDNYEEVAKIASEESTSDEAVAKEEPVITFEERWTQLLDNCKQKLNNLTDDDKDGQVRDLWTSINKYVTIMAVPKEIMPKMRKTLWKMARRSSFSQAKTLLLYALLTFFPRRSYRSVEAQQYFKKRLTRIANK